MNTNIIGILAGMGPKSTAPFLNLVINECQSQYNAKDDIDFPHMIIYSLPTPFYVDKPIDHDVMKKTIIEGLRYLENINVKFIAMPCNSAHIYYDELKSSINIPLLNIVDETIKNLDKSVKKVSLFATPSTFNSKIYQQGIIDNGFEFCFKNEWQSTLNQIIKSIKFNTDNDDSFKLWNSLLESVKKEGVDSIIIACTDLNVMFKEKDKNSSIKFIDSSSCLANSTIKKYLQFNK